MKRTPLHPVYSEYGAKITDFGGWEMPLQFSGIVDEHHAVRTAAGLFDVSHMGEIEISGPGALELTQRLLTNDLSTVQEGRAVYACMCRPDGGIIDDLLVFRLAGDRFLLVVNAANTAKDLEHIKAVAEDFVAAGGEPVEVTDKTDSYAVLALQGPQAAAILRHLYDGPADSSPDILRPFRFLTDVSVAGHRLPLVSRTGYTGEDGFELYLHPDGAIAVWRALLVAGKVHGLKPAGLGARDTLRFEACLPLYGQELTEETNPLEAGLGFFVKLDKQTDFIGRQALQAISERGPQRKLVGLELVERGIPRTGYPVTDGHGTVIGEVTSGAMSPTLQKSLALAYVPAEMAKIGAMLAVQIRGQERRARIVETPFYRRRG